MKKRTVFTFSTAVLYAAHPIIRIPHLITNYNFHEAAPCLIRAGKTNPDLKRIVVRTHLNRTSCASLMQKHQPYDWCFSSADIFSAFTAYPSPPRGQEARPFVFHPLIKRRCIDQLDSDSYHTAQKRSRNDHDDQHCLSPVSDLLRLPASVSCYACSGRSSFFGSRIAAAM